MTRRTLIISVLGFLVTTVLIMTLRHLDFTQPTETFNAAKPISPFSFFKTDPSKLKIPNNRTLWIIMGNLRGGENAWESLYRNVLNINDADLALAIGVRKLHNNQTVRPPRTANSSLYRHAKYVWEFEEFDDWSDGLDMMITTKGHSNNGSSWQALLDYHDDNGVLGGCGNHSGSGAVIFWIRWFISQQLMANGYALLKQYGRFVVTRADHYYLCPHNLSELDMDEVWVPDGIERGQDEQGINHGVTDRHVVAPNYKILEVLDILTPVLNNPDYYMTEREDYSAHFNPEAYIFWRWQDQGITAQYFPRTFFTCAVLGDMTRWSAMTAMVVPEGVHLKYTDEYVASHHECWDRNFTKQLHSQGFLKPNLPHHRHHHHHV